MENEGPWLKVYLEVNLIMDREHLTYICVQAGYSMV